MYPLIGFIEPLLAALAVAPKAGPKPTAPNILPIGIPLTLSPAKPKPFLPNQD